MKKKSSRPAKATAKPKKPAPPSKSVPPDLSAIVATLNEVIYARDLAGTMTYVSPAAERIFGLKPSEVMGKSFLSYVHPDDRGYVAGVTRSIERGEFVDAEYRLVGKTGEQRWINVKAHPTMHKGKVVGAHGVIVDVTERKRLEADLLDSQKKLQDALANEMEAATADALTHLANRRALFASGETEVRRARRYQRPLALAYLDLDNFKTVNDALGHEVGDALLVTVAALIKGNVRTTDLVARLGGDEFAVLLPETDGPGAQVVLDKVREALRDTFARVSARLSPALPRRTVGCSIGVGALSEEHLRFDDLLRAADHQMYQAKRAARAGA